MRRILVGVTSLIAMTSGMVTVDDDIQNMTSRPAPKRHRPRVRWPSDGRIPANKRAAARLEAHRAIWDNTPSADKMTRQRRRRAAMGRV